jgi:hypothetical protein
LIVGQAEWIEHRRQDGEPIGWVRPEGEEFVPVDRLGRDLSRLPTGSTPSGLSMRRASATLLVRLNSNSRTVPGNRFGWSKSRPPCHFRLPKRSGFPPLSRVSNAGVPKRPSRGIRAGLISTSKERRELCRLTLPGCRSPAPRCHVFARNTWSCARDLNRRAARGRTGEYRRFATGVAARLVALAVQRDRVLVLPPESGIGPCSAVLADRGDPERPPHSNLAPVPSSERR